ncbi:hypothetical protein ACFLY4_09750 [Chloroflexota bacterium]
MIKVDKTAVDICIFLTNNQIDSLEIIENFVNTEIEEFQEVDEGKSWLIEMKNIDNSTELSYGSLFIFVSPYNIDLNKFQVIMSLYKQKVFDRGYGNFMEIMPFIFALDFEEFITDFTQLYNKYHRRKPITLIQLSG